MRWCSGGNPVDAVRVHETLRITADRCGEGIIVWHHRQKATDAVLIQLWFVLHHDSASTLLIAQYLKDTLRSR